MTASFQATDMPVLAGDTPARLRPVGPSDEGVKLMLPDGRLVDPELPPRGEVDPLIDDCDPWCEDAEAGHRRPVMFDVDRVHYSHEVHVPVRSRATYDSDSRTIALSAVRMFLERRVNERDPRLWVGVDEEAWLELTPAEAWRIGRGLIDLAARTVTR